MKKTFFAKTLVCLLTVFLSISATSAQKNKPVKTKAKPIIFAVLNDGKTLEPIAVIDNGKLTQASDGGDDAKKIAAFVKTYYQPKTTYQLVFGGAGDGTVTIDKSNAASDCAKNMAEVTTVAKTAKLSGLVMGLATSAPINKIAKVIRRKPTPAERAEIEALVRAEYAKQKVSDNVLKNLHYHNLTALDVDNDGSAEMVGSFWIETAPTERALLFFIADKTGGKYSFGYSDFKIVKQDEVMSGNIKDLDNGVYNELLLDILDYNGDKTSEIFTYVESFEGAGFNAYKREGGKWVKAFEGSNYHCAF
ncbi:MAG TPA: hypothetical protein VGC76_01380 [Pyrinomonadaceae bacterium]|jgi:hypothetical protein